MTDHLGRRMDGFGLVPRSTPVAHTRASSRIIATATNPLNWFTHLCASSHPLPARSTELGRTRLLSCDVNRN